MEIRKRIYLTHKIKVVNSVELYNQWSIEVKISAVFFTARKSRSVHNIAIGGAIEVVVIKNAQFRFGRICVKFTVARTHFFTMGLKNENYSSN